MIISLESKFIHPISSFSHRLSTLMIQTPLEIMNAGLRCSWNLLLMELRKIGREKNNGLKVLDWLLKLLKKLMARYSMKRLELQVSWVGSRLHFYQSPLDGWQRPNKRNGDIAKRTQGVNIADIAFLLPLPRLLFGFFVFQTSPLNTKTIQNTHLSYSIKERFKEYINDSICI